MTLTSSSSRHIGERGGDDESVKPPLLLWKVSLRSMFQYFRGIKKAGTFFSWNAGSAVASPMGPRFPYLPGWSPLAHVNTTSPSFPSSSPFPSIHSINRRSPHSVFSFSFQSQHSRHFAPIEIVTSYFVSSRSFLSYSGQSKFHLSFLLSYSI